MKHLPKGPISPGDDTPQEASPANDVLTKGSSTKPLPGLVLPAQSLQSLIEQLLAEGYRVLGPVVENEVIVYDELYHVDQLPQGLQDEQAPGHYRLRRRDDQAWFGHAVGPQSFKRWLRPPQSTMWTARRNPHTGQLEIDDASPPPQPLAFLGIRPCDLAAAGLLDKVLLYSGYRDLAYARTREQALVIVAQCYAPAATCFCTSQQTGPRAERGFDLALTEFPRGSVATPGHHFVVEVGSPAGARLLAPLHLAPASPLHTQQALDLTKSAARSMTRHLENDGLRELLHANQQHTLWEDIAQRCLACANCTLVCPSCFCTRSDTITDLAGTEARHERTWDSCFTSSFSSMHGGCARPSTYARYRHWMTHKLASWHDQFGSSGCVGCGRCVSWCPAGIDLVEEVSKLRNCAPSGLLAAQTTPGPRPAEVSPP